MILKWHNLKEKKHTLKATLQKVNVFPKQSDQVMGRGGSGCVGGSGQRWMKTGKESSSDVSAMSEHLNPLLSFSNARVALGCLASKDVLIDEYAPPMEGIDGLNHPTRTCILGHIPPRGPFHEDSQLCAQKRDERPWDHTLAKRLEKTHWDLRGGIVKHSPKIWLSIVPVQCFRHGGGGFSPCALHWPHAAPLKPKASPQTESFKSPNLGFSILLSPSQAGWEHLCCHVGFAELPKWGKKHPKERQGTQMERNRAQLCMPQCHL